MNKEEEMFDAIYDDQIARLKELIEAGADVNLPCVRNTPLNHAIGRRRTECVRLLLNSGADVNASGDGLQTPIDVAMESNATECLRLLLDSGAGNVNMFYVRRSIKNIVVECLEMLIDSGVDVKKRNDPRDRTLLNEAIRSSHPECIRLLLKKGFIMDKSDLFDAIDLKYAACLEALIETGADVNARDTSGRSLLRKAVDMNHTECVKLLIEAGADVNAVHNNSYPIHSAAERENQRILELLLKAGADINAINYQGFTPIMCAIDRNGPKIEIVKFLLANNAEIRTDFGVNKRGIVFVSKKDLTDALILFCAAGGKITFMYDEETPLFEINLKNICREAIRKHLLDLDPCQHLFGRIPRLPLPKPLKTYLLFDMSLEEAEETDEGISGNAIGHC